MDADLFLQQFGYLAQGEGGIKKLRDVILQLAVRGKLVEQNPADEPAEVLLKKIQAAKKQLIKDGAVKEIKTPPAKVYDILPRGWRWVKLADVAYPQAGFAFKSGGFNEAKIGMPLIRIRDVGASNPQTYYQGEYRPEFVANHGDYLIGMDGDFRVAKWLGSEALLNQRVSRLIFYYDAMPHSLIAIALQIELYKLQGVKAYTTVDHLSGKQIAESVIALPPLAEQKRIVVKVDELMALCDKLEAAQKTQRTLKTQAVQSTLHHLTSAENPTSFGTSLNILERTFGNWFDDLTTVKHLRATILQLAVQGKLVPQNPTDESAEKLVNRVNKKKHQFKPTETPFLLPHGWTWASFPQLGEFGRGKSKHRPRNDPRLYSGGKHPFVQTGDVSRARDYIRIYSATYNDEGLAQSKMWPAGTMCITIAANIAETAILAFDACFPDSVVGFIPDKEIGDARYFEYFLRTAKTRLEDFAPATAQKNINLGILEQVAIPLPPNPELKRIVAKVDELMTLCDQLEARITHTQTLNTHLMDSLIHRMTEAA